MFETGGNTSHMGPDSGENIVKGTKSGDHKSAMMSCDTCGQQHG